MTGHKTASSAVCNRDGAHAFEAWAAVNTVAQRTDKPEPQTERSLRRSRLRRAVDDEWGRSESIDPDNVGDIADEGAGHRG